MDGICDITVPSDVTYVHKPSLSQNKILVRILINSSSILILFIFPEFKDFSKLKTAIFSIPEIRVELCCLIPYLNEWFRQMFS